MPAPGLAGGWRKRVPAGLLILALAAIAGCTVAIPGTPSDIGSFSWKFIPEKDLDATGDAPAGKFLVSFGRGYVVAREGPAQSWFSPDGTVWTESDLGASAASSASGDVSITEIISVEGAVYAYGEDGSAARRGKPVAFATEDGVHWVSAPGLIPPEFRDETGLKIRAALLDGHLVLTGLNHRVWVTKDSKDWGIPDQWITWWERGQLDIPCSGANRGVTDLGLLVMGGCPPSDDGSTPGRVELLRVTPGGTVDDLGHGIDLAWCTAAASSSRTTVIIGFGNSEAETADDIEVSRDFGRTWQNPKSFENPDDAATVEVQSITGVGSKFVISGTYLSASKQVRIPVAWTSSDSGTSWKLSRLPLFDREGTVRHAATRNGRVVLLANDQYDNETRGVIVSG